MLSKEDARALIGGIIPDGMDVKRLSAKAKAEKRAALDTVLKLAAIISAETVK